MLFELGIHSPPGARPSSEWRELEWSGVMQLFSWLVALGVSALSAPAVSVSAEIPNVSVTESLMP